MARVGGWLDNVSFFIELVQTTPWWFISCCAPRFRVKIDSRGHYNKNAAVAQC